MITQNKRERLIDSAAKLFHHSGLSATSLADIARDADIPIGNVYYYFKTKEELATAAVGRQREQFVAAYALLDGAFADPRQRLLEALGYFDKVREEYASYGCPIARIIYDVDAAKDPIGQAAAQVFKDFLEWSEKQFRHLGHGDAALSHAITLMCGLQGAFILAKTLRKPQIISDEIARLVLWLESVPNKKIQIGKARVASSVA